MRIMIVEDEYYLAADLADSLRSAGIEVAGPVGTVAEAERLLNVGDVDRAILDVNLRGDMSFPIADRLDAAGVPYVIATGYSGESLPERFRDKPRLEKPYRPEAAKRLLLQTA